MQPLTRADILDPAAYDAARDDHRRRVLDVKRHRRVEVGPHAAFYFENAATVWYQIHEMLRIERGGEAQIADELAAYNPLVPNGRELVATLMFEIENATRRAAILATLGGVEEAIFLTINGDRVPGEAERDIDRTTADGKASAVHFIHFALSDDQAAAFKAADAEVAIAMEHPGYGHVARLPANARAALAQDLD